MRNKHKRSPEPWRCILSECMDESDGIFWDIQDADGHPIVVIIESQADALAMSAAPDLLAACMAMVEQMTISIEAAKTGVKPSARSYRSAIAQGVAAVTKATKAS